MLSTTLLMRPRQKEPGNAEAYRAALRQVAESAIRESGNGTAAAGFAWRPDDSVGAA